jgi:hypothetical protein
MGHMHLLSTHQMNCRVAVHILQQAVCSCLVHFRLFGQHGLYRKWLPHQALHVRHRAS